MKKILIYASFIISLILTSSFSLYSQEVQEKTAPKEFEFFQHLPSEMQLEIASSIITDSTYLKYSIREFLNLLSANISLNNFLNSDNKKFIKDALLKYVDKTVLNKGLLIHLIKNSLSQHNFKLANFLLLADINPNITYIDNFNKNNALIDAAKNNYLEIVKFLLNSNSVNYNTVNEALTDTIQNNNIEAAQLLLTNKNASEHHKGLILMDAAKNNNIKIVKLLTFNLISKISNGDNKVKNGAIYLGEALAIAAKNNYIEITKFLLNNSFDSYGTGRALIKAIKNNNIKIIQLLLDHDINLYHKKEAYRLSKEKNYTKITKLLANAFRKKK